MLGLRVTVPIACFRKGMAREYLETEMLPPPATCYGFLLSLVGPGMSVAASRPCLSIVRSRASSFAPSGA
jgi:CRISPR-associated Cas5-like protein